jgi:hypothetical protein
VQACGRFGRCCSGILNSFVSFGMLWTVQRSYLTFMIFVLTLPAATWQTCIPIGNNSILL